VTNSHRADVTVHDVHAEPAAVPGLDGAVIPHRPAGADFGRRVFTQTVPARSTATSATVSFTAVELDASRRLRGARGDRGQRLRHGDGDRDEPARRGPGDRGDHLRPGEEVDDGGGR
jgi:hypothetical protein